MPDFVRRIPDGDNRERLIRADCGHPAHDKTLQERAARAAWEEARADLAVPSVIWALDTWQNAGKGPFGVPAGNPATDPRGTRRPPRPASGIDP